MTFFFRLLVKPSRLQCLYNLYQQIIAHTPFRKGQIFNTWASSYSLINKSSLINNISVSATNTPIISQKKRRIKKITRNGQIVQLNKYLPKSPGRAILLSRENLSEDVAHLTFQPTDDKFAYLSGQSISIFPKNSLELKKDKIRDNKSIVPRVYSIASPGQFNVEDGENGESEKLQPNNTIDLCVKLLRKDDGSLGECSSFLHNLKVGRIVDFCGPIGTEMLLPNNISSDIIAIATGTGIAPFRGFWQEILNGKNTSKMHLIYGCKSIEETSYFSEILNFCQKYPENFKVDICLSRESIESIRKTLGILEFENFAEFDGIVHIGENCRIWPKKYVDSAVKEYVGQSNISLDPHWYICGLRVMETGVYSAIGKENVDKLKKMKKLHVEVY